MIYLFSLWNHFAVCFFFYHIGTVHISAVLLPYCVLVLFPVSISRQTLPKILRVERYFTFILNDYLFFFQPTHLYPVYSFLFYPDIRIHFEWFLHHTLLFQYGAFYSEIITISPLNNRSDASLHIQDYIWLTRQNVNWK